MFPEFTFPPILISSTLELLTEYLEKGGKVLSFRRDIVWVDGEESPKGNNLAANFTKQWIICLNLEDVAALDMLGSEEFN